MRQSYRNQRTISITSFTARSEDSDLAIRLPPLPISGRSGRLAHLAFRQKAFASPGRRRCIPMLSCVWRVSVRRSQQRIVRLLRWIAWHCTHHRGLSGMLGSSIVPFDFSGRAALSVRSRLVFCLAPGACELNAGDTRLTAYWLRGLRHCSRIRFWRGCRSFRHLRIEIWRRRNLRAVARQRAFGQRLGRQAASSCFVAPKRGEAGWEGRNNTDFLTIENEPGRNNTAVCFHAGIVFGSCGLSPVPLGLHPRFAAQIACGGAWGSLWNDGRPAAPPVCRSTPPQSQVARIAAQKKGRAPLNPAPLTVEHTHQGGCRSARVFFRPHRRRCRHGADRFGLLRGPF